MNLETLTQRNLFLMVVLGDFNAKSKHWCNQDSTNFEGISIKNVTSQFGLSQIITEATHILGSSSSCIDLIFTTQPNLVVESGVHPSLHPNCHHQIVFAKFNLQIYTHHHTLEKSGTTNKQILNLLEEQLLTLTVIDPFSILMLTRKFLSSAALY